MNVSLRELVRPLSKAIGLLGAGVEKDGAGAVDEEGAQVAVAALRDAPQVSLESAREFPRGETQVAGEVSAGGEPMDALSLVGSSRA